MFTIMLTTNSLEYTVLQVDMLYHIIVLQSNNIDHYQLILHTYLQLRHWLRHSLVLPHEVNSLQALGMGGREGSRGTSCPPLCIHPISSTGGWSGCGRWAWFQMPPTSAGVKFHIMRSHYQASIWNKAQLPDHDLPLVDEMGWIHKGGQLVPLHVGVRSASANAAAAGMYEGLADSDQYY